MPKLIWELCITEISTLCMSELATFMEPYQESPQWRFRPFPALLVFYQNWPAIESLVWRFPVWLNTLQRTIIKLVTANYCNTTQGISLTVQSKSLFCLKMGAVQSLTRNGLDTKICKNCGILLYACALKIPSAEPKSFMPRSDSQAPKHAKLPGTSSRSPWPCPFCTVGHNI